MPRPLVLLFLLLVTTLTVLAHIDPELPFLPGSPGRTWWVHPEPLSLHGASGPHQLTFRFTPRRAGQMTLTAMSRFRLYGHGQLLAAGPEPGRSWKRVHDIQIALEPLEVWCEDARLLPALALGGEAAPEAVSVWRDGQQAAAVPVAELMRFRPALGAYPQLATLGRLLALLLAGGFALALLAPIRTSRQADPSPSRPRPRFITVIIAVFIAISAWNVSRYPAARGLDAEGHLEYIRLIAATGALPGADAGWQTYHPPLYHLIAAPAVALLGGRAAQALSAFAAVILLLTAARQLGAARWRGTLLIAALPVLLLTAPQVTNEVWFAMLATATLVAAGCERPTFASASAAGLFAGLSLLTRYTGLPFLIAATVAPLLKATPGRTRGMACAGLTLSIALALAGSTYHARWQAHGDPFAGNWDDALGHAYRQPPGVRTAGWFLGFGASLVAHPFEARKASLLDSLYVSTIGDGFGRFLITPAQHAAMLALAWLALPLLLTTIAGFANLMLRRPPREPTRLELTCLITVMLAFAALVRFNLELPYWSTAKGVFMLGLALPLAMAFEHGRQLLLERGCTRWARLTDVALAAFAVVSAWTFVYRA